jgi:hypothetical protein
LHLALQGCFDNGEALLVLLEQCMTWASAGVLSTITAGVPVSLDIIDEAVAAEQKGFIFLQISDSYRGFDKPANPNVDYLAAAQAVFAVYHRRISCNEFAFTETRLIMTAIYSHAK